MFKNTGLQGSTLSGHRMTTGFGPFKLPTHGLLQNGGGGGPLPTQGLKSPALWMAFTEL